MPASGTSLADSSGNGITGAAVDGPHGSRASRSPRRPPGTTPCSSTARASTRPWAAPASCARPTFTLELWFKRTGAGVGTGTGSGGIASAIPLITKGRAEAETAAADINYFLGIDATSGKLVADFEEAQIAQGGTTPGLNHPITGTAVIAADSTWHHAAATYDGTTWNLYLDGVLDGTLSRRPGRAATPLTNVTTVARHRAEHDDGRCAVGFFAGVVDEVRIWNAARSQAQIQAAKNAAITTAQAGLLGVWNLDAGFGTSLADSSGNGIAGAAVNGPDMGRGLRRASRASSTRCPGPDGTRQCRHGYLAVSDPRCRRLRPGRRYGQRRILRTGACQRIVRAHRDAIGRGSGATRHDGVAEPGRRSDLRVVRPRSATERPPRRGRHGPSTRRPGPAPCSSEWETPLPA